MAPLGIGGRFPKYSVWIASVKMDRMEKGSVRYQFGPSEAHFMEPGRDEGGAAASQYT